MINKPNLNTMKMKMITCATALLFSGMIAKAQSNELAMASIEETITTIEQNASQLNYQITDINGKQIAEGQLKTNASLAVSVPVGIYTLRITDDKKQTKGENVAIEGNETSGNTSIGYIVVKLDNKGTVTCQKLLL